MYGRPHPNRITCNEIKIRYPFFYKIEKPRQNGSDIQVRCHLNICGKWFTPNYEQLRSRIYALENENGNDGLFFYCCEKCKDECPSYALKNDPFRIIKQYYTKNEYQQFREYVLERDKNKRQFCGEKAEHVHHERPQKLEPFHSLDPYFAWSVCRECHYEKGHKDECSIGKLANTICI